MGWLLRGPAAVHRQRRAANLRGSLRTQKHGQRTDLLGRRKFMRRLLFRQQFGFGLIDRDLLACGPLPNLLVDQWRQDPAWADCIAGNPGRGSLKRHNLGQPKHAVFGRNVGGLFHGGYEPVCRGDVDDASPIRENLTLDGKRALKTLLAANKRLNTAYLLKESFGQLWSYEREGWARRFFENWRASLKWQRLKPYEKFSAMIDRHWDGIAAYCRPENKVSLGFVEGLNNKIRVIQRRAYGLRDEDYLRLKILTCMLPTL